MKPPSHLDSAKVLYWAWSGDKPFWIMSDINGNIVAEIYGVAICLLSSKVYRFSCDSNWKVQNDTDFQSIQEAMAALYTEYQNQPIHWMKFDDTDIDLLMSESKMVKFYQEVGERQIIQKIIAHLNEYNCEGMNVQSIEKDTWVLSIQKKDVPIASEVAKQNVN